MTKKQSNNYESPQIKALQFDEEDILTSSGDTYVQWGWGDEPYNGDFS